MDSDDEFMDPDEFMDIVPDLIPNFNLLVKSPVVVSTKDKVKVLSRKETIEFICKNYFGNKDKIRAELLLDFLYMSVVSAVMEKMGLDYKKKLYSNKKKLLNSNIRNFLYNCIRTNNGEDPKDLYEEEFVIKELAPEDYATKREIGEDLSKCSECGSTNVYIDPVMQTITCRNCGYTKQTRANGITFSHLASYVDNNNYVKTTSGKKIYVKSIDEVITTLYKKINELFGSDELKLTPIMDRIQGLGYRNIPTGELYGRIVKLIISMYPRDYYNNAESLNELLNKFRLTEHFHEYNQFVISENFKNLFHKYKGSITDNCKNKYITSGNVFNIKMPILDFATLLWMSKWKGREEIAIIFGLNPMALTNRCNELKPKAKKFLTK